MKSRCQHIGLSYRLSPGNEGELVYICNECRVQAHINITDAVAHPKPPYHLARERMLAMTTPPKPTDQERWSTRHRRAIRRARLVKSQRIR